VLGVLAAETLTPRWVHMPVKWLLATVRGIPLILVAMLMVGAVGLGPLPGILAITFHATGMLAKFYAEAIEGVDRTRVEALESTGATLLQRLRFGAWPQMAPVIVRDTLFRFEMNLRESLILGIVGAGGIGFYIQVYVRTFQYDKVATLTIVVVLFVVLIEIANNAIRRLLR
jgi:phosphonate transport system permease protein